MTDIEQPAFLKTCPHCGKEIKAKADLCKYCRGDVSSGVMLAVAATARAEAEQHPETKTCPYCAEAIKWDAKVCKHCHRDLATGGIGTVALQPTPQWSKGVAAVLSLVIPGAGQMYKGQVLNGMVWLFFVVFGYVLFILPGVILHLCCIAGAASGDPYT